MLKNWSSWTVVLEKTPESPLDCKESQPVHPKGDQSLIFIGTTDAEAPILWQTDAKNRLIRKDSWFWERLKTGGEGDNRGWDGWMASQTQWTWVWVNSGSWWWTGRPGLLQSVGLQRVRHTERLNWTTFLVTHAPDKLAIYLVQSETSGLKMVTCDPFAWNAHAPFLALLLPLVWSQGYFESNSLDYPLCIIFPVTFILLYCFPHHNL